MNYYFWHTVHHSLRERESDCVLPRREVTLRLNGLSLYVCLLFLNTTTSLLTNIFLQTMAREGEHAQRSWVKVGDTLCQNSKLKPNPSLKFLRHRKKKNDLQLQQNCNSMKRKYQSIYLLSARDLKLAGFVILLSPLYMEVAGVGWKARGVKKN